AKSKQKELEKNILTKVSGNNPSTSSFFSTSSNSSSSTQVRSNTLVAENVVIESCLDGYDNDDDDLCDPDLSSDNENPIDDDISVNELTHSNFKQKSRETINKNTNLQKKIWLASTIGAIAEAIYDAIKKIKYPTNEHLMKICYDMLSDIKKDEFQNKSNIVVKNAILTRISVHFEFPDLVKLKTGNRQVMYKKERKFKEADVTKECYLKLNHPIDVNDDLHYTYLNLIINCTFADPNTEKNSIAFGMAVALNYLDPSKRISMVPSEVIE
ncbi:7751_t:CDS:2, partial [Racocetra persica]